MAVDEVMRIRLEADASDIEKKVKEVDAKLSQFEKAKKSVQLRAEIGVLKADLDKARKELSGFKKIGDRESIIKAQMNVQGIQDSLRIVQKELVATTKSLSQGEYAKMSATLNSLRTKYKDLALTQGEDSASAIKLRSEIQSLDIQLRRIDATVGQHQRNVGNYKSALDGLTNSIDKSKIEYQKIINIYGKGSAEAKKQEANIKSLTEEFKNLKKESANTSSSLRGVGDFLGGLKGKFLSLFGIVAVGTATMDTLQKSMEFEQTRISFDVLFGTVEEGRKMLQELTTFAKNTPFTIQGVEQSALQLKAYGLATENIIPTLKVFGNISRGQEDIFNRLIYAYGQVTAAGKLYGTELRQFTDAGIPLIDALAQQFGVTAGEIRKMTEEGRISSKDVTEALQEMQKEGGRFANLMEKQSKTAIGAWSNIKDSVAATQRRFADTTAYKIIVKALNWVADNLQNIATVFGNTVTFISGSALLAGKYIYEGFKFGVIGVFEVFKGLLQAVGFVGKVIQEEFAYLTGYIPSSFKNAFLSVARSITEYFLKPLENGVNSAIEMLNKLPNVNIGRVSFTGIDLRGIEAPKFDFAKSKESWKKGTQELENLKSVFASSFGEFTKNQSRNLNVPDINTSLLPSSITPSGSGSGSGSGSSKVSQAQKEADEIQKIEEARIKEEAEMREKQAKKIRELQKERLDDVGELTEKTKKYYKELEEGIQKARDEQAKLRKELEDYNAELDKSTATDLQGRQLDLLEKEKELKAEIQKIDEEFGIKSSQEKMQAQQKFSEELQKNIEEQKKLSKFIEENNLQSQFTEAQRVSGLSPTEKIIEEYELKKATKQKEIEDEIARQEAVIQVNSDGLEQLKQFEKELFDKRQTYLKATEEALGGSVNRQKKKYQELIDQIQVAIAQQERLNALRGESISGSTVDNSKTINISQTVNSQSDADYYIQATKQL